MPETVLTKKRVQGSRKPIIGTEIPEQFKQLLSGQNKISEDIAALRTQQAFITGLSARFAELEQRTARIDTLEQTIVSLQAKITVLEDRKIDPT